MSLDEENIQFQLTDELWAEMQALEGLPISSIIVWDSSLIDDSLEHPVSDEERVFVDCELYLANQTLLELYGVAFLEDEAGEALVGLDAINAVLEHLTSTGVFLQEVAADQEDRLVLTIGNEAGEFVLAAVTAWLETSWDTLPEDAYI